MPNLNPLLAIGAPAIVVGIAIGIVVPHAQGGVNDDNPVGFRSRPAPQQNLQASPQPSPHPSATFAHPRMWGTAPCFTSSRPCKITIDVLQEPPPDKICEQGDGSPPCHLISCPADASCLEFSGRYSVQHIRKKHFLIWENGLEAHDPTPLDLTGIVVVQ